MMILVVLVSALVLMNIDEYLEQERRNETM